MIKDDTLDPQSESRYFPLKSRELAQKFSRFWVDECGNTSSDNLLVLWELIFENISESYHRNTSGAEKVYMVVPAPTGSGKTQCFRFYAAELAKKEFDDGERPGMLIVTTFTSEIDEAVEQINRMTGRKVAAAYHSESEIKLEQQEYLLNEYQIVVISHEYYIRNHYLKAVNNDVFQQVANYQDKPRPIVVIDESIKLINNIGIERRDLSSLKNNIASLYDEDSGLEQEYKLISYLHKHFDNLFDKELGNGLTNLIGDKSKLLSNLSDELGVSAERVKQIFNLPKSIEALNSGKLYEANKAVGADGKRDILRDAANLRYLLDDALYKYGAKGAASYRTSTLELPSHSLVVLDATAHVDKFYSEFPHRSIRSLPSVKTYEQVTIKLLYTKSQLGKSTLKDNSELHWSNIFFHLFEQEMNPDNTAVFVHKSLKKAMGEDNYKVDNFGNLVGVNRYKDCTNVVIYGMHYKPKSVYYDDLYQSTKDLSVYDKRSVCTAGGVISVEDMQYSNMAADIIQAINRGSCRKIVDGKAPKMNVILLLPNNKELSKVIVDSIKSELTDVVIDKKNYNLEFDIKKDTVKSPKGRDSVLIECIDTTLNEIRLSDLYEKAGTTTKKVRERIIKHLTKPEHTNSYLAVETSKLGYQAEKKGGQWYLIKHPAG